MNGSCFCGQVSFVVEGDPLSSIICHCTSCRRASGAPSVAWVTYHVANFRLVEGEVTAYRSSEGVLRSFCGRCGTPLFYENDADPDTLDITSVSLADPSIHAPTREEWLEDKLAWEVSNRHIGQYPRDENDGPYPKPG